MKSAVLVSSFFVFAMAGRAKRAKQVATHVLIDAENAAWSDGAQMATSATWVGWNPDMSKPWLLTNGKDCFEGAEVQKALKGFVSLFKDSSIRVTEGRAQAPAAADAAAEVQAALGSLLPGDLAFSLSAEDRQKSPQLAKAMVCATFGIAASHMCLGKFELSLMPCLRATYQGSRFTTVVLLSAVLKRLKEPSLQQVQDYLFKCTEGQLQELTREGGAFCATVGPNDLLFLPPGCMVSHKIFAQDVCGLRVGLLDVHMEADLRTVATLGDETGCVAQALACLEQRLAAGLPSKDGAEPKAAGVEGEAQQNPGQVVKADAHQQADGKPEANKAPLADAKAEASKKEQLEEEAKKKQEEEEMAKAAKKKQEEEEEMAKAAEKKEEEEEKAKAAKKKEEEEETAKAAKKKREEEEVAKAAKKKHEEEEEMAKAAEKNRLAQIAKETQKAEEVAAAAAKVEAEKRQSEEANKLVEKGQASPAAATAAAKAVAEKKDAKRNALATALAHGSAAKP